MNTDCLCWDTHEACHSVANIQPVLYIALPDRQMGWPPSDLWHSTFVEARPWILSSGLHHSQMFCQNGRRMLEPTWARCCLRGGHMTSDEIPTDFLDYTRHFGLNTANSSGSHKQQRCSCSCRGASTHIKKNPVIEENILHVQDGTPDLCFSDCKLKDCFGINSTFLCRKCVPAINYQHEIRGWRRIK